MEEIKFGIEQELIFVNEKNEILDFTNSTYFQFKKIVDEFPFYEGDEKYFHIKSTEIKPKRCYIEGFELHDEKGNIKETIPKGLEIRTTPHSNIQNLIEELKISLNLVKKITSKYGMYPILISYHLLRSKFEISEKILEHEKKFRTLREFKIAIESMLTFGMHVGISSKNWDEETLINIKEKLNYYLPFIIPFSFSSPFFEGKEFGGECYRNYFRANFCPLVEIRKIGEQKYVEFKPYDSVESEEVLKGLIYLLKGVILDKDLTNYSVNQNSDLIKKSSLYGFKNEFIKKEATNILESVSKTLNKESVYLKPLWKILETNQIYSQKMKKRFKETKDIFKSIKMYEF